MTLGHTHVPIVENVFIKNRIWRNTRTFIQVNSISFFILWIFFSPIFFQQIILRISVTWIVNLKSKSVVSHSPSSIILDVNHELFLTFFIRRFVRQSVWKTATRHFSALFYMCHLLFSRKTDLRKRSFYEILIFTSLTAKLFKNNTKSILKLRGSSCDFLLQVFIVADYFSVTRANKVRVTMDCLRTSLYKKI